MTAQNSAKTAKKIGRPFPKGKSGNPGGRPKKTQLTDACRALLKTEFPGDLQGRTYAERIAEVLCRTAIKGDIRAIRELADRAEGRPRQAIQIEQDPPGKEFEGRDDDELYFYVKHGTREQPWPTSEERQYYARMGTWPQDKLCIRCKHEVDSKSETLI
jgi:hypothetical protein